MARQAKTEDKAKGLIGWKDGKRDKSAPASVGDYKGKTLNLSKKELGKAGQKAAAARTIDISKTKYDSTTKRVMGPKGKAITGKVDLGGGNFAVYKNGRRVRANSGPNVSPASSSGRGGGQTAAGSVDAGKKGQKPLAAQSGYQAGSSTKKPSGFGYGAMNKTGKGSKGTKASKPEMVYVKSINQWVPKKGYTAATNPNNKGRVQGMREGRAATPGLALELAGLYGAGRLAAAGASRAIGRTGIAKAGDLAGKGAKEGIASAGKSMSSSGRGAASAPKPAAAAKPATPPAKGQTSRGVSKKTGGPVKDGKPQRLGPKKPTAKQSAQSRRQMGAWKGQQTKKANAAKKTTKKK